jgi:L-rhamnose isomerase
VWIPDGFKDTPVDRAGHRRILAESLDAVFAEKADPATLVDAVEGKLFGIGMESCTIGSHDFYLSYALSRGVTLCMDTGHFHPTESVADKLSAVLPFARNVLLHISRPVRWDSDHVCVANDELAALAEELVRCDVIGTNRVFLALDFFDASINRVGALIVGARAVLRAVLAALLQPLAKLRELEEHGKGFERLALLEECKAMPIGAVWDEFCRRKGVPTGTEWIAAVSKYEEEILNHRK